MFGYGTEHLGHLTSSGTIANLEALFVARETHPGNGIAYSADAHYTHSPDVPPARHRGTRRGRPTPPAGWTSTHSRSCCARARSGPWCMTAGTTGLGAIDPIARGRARCARSYGVRIHVDAAYGGFFRLIADDTADGVAAAPFRAIAECDSIVIDPHKHGLQPYGCGAVLFRDPSVARHYLHDSPYTYFTSDELHLGEISLECSRSGAAAAALWLTLQLLPLTPDGLGAVLRPGRRAAPGWATALIRLRSARRSSSPLSSTSSPTSRAGPRCPRSTGSPATCSTPGSPCRPTKPLFVATYDVTPRRWPPVATA